MSTPFIRIEATGQKHVLAREVTTVGRGDGVDIAIADASVSRLHAELVRRGPHVYVSDLGLSTNGTRVNGRPVNRQVLSDGDVIGFGAARARIGGVPHSSQPDETVRARSITVPEITRRENEVLEALCQPALHHEAFVEPATAKSIADALVVTEAAVKQHLLRLYQKFRIPEGPGRRSRLANEVIAQGIIRPMPQPDGDGDGQLHEVRRAG